jgi:hypothetical protein
VRDADVIWQAYDSDGDCVQLLRRHDAGGYALQVVGHGYRVQEHYVNLSDTDLRELETAIRREK